MAKGKTIERYIISLTPRFDVEKYEQERAKIRKAIRLDFKDIDAKTKKEAIADQKRALDFAKKIEQLETVATRRKREEVKLQTDIVKKKREEIRLENLANSKKNGKSGLSLSQIKSGAAFGQAGIIAVAVFKATQVIERLTEQLIKYNTNIANQLVSANSAFVNSSTRRIMATFGTSATTAMGLQSSMSIMGISQEELATMTSGQLRYLQSLMRTWFDGLSNIDQNKLKEYSDLLQGFQMAIGTSKLQLQLNLMKAMVDNDGLANMLNATKDLFSTIARLAGSGTFKQLISLFGNAVAFIENVLNTLLNVAELLDPVLTPILNALNNAMNLVNYIGELINMVMTVPFWEWDENMPTWGGNYAGAVTTNNSRVVTITETTTNNFNGTDTSIQAIANASASNVNTYANRLAIATMI